MNSDRRYAAVAALVEMKIRNGSGRLDVSSDNGSIIFSKVGA